MRCPRIFHPAHQNRAPQFKNGKTPRFLKAYAHPAATVPSICRPHTEIAPKQWCPAAPAKEQQGISARRACKPDSVEDGHSSRRRITARAPATYPKVSAHPAQKPRGSPRWRTGQVRRTVSRAELFFPSYLVLLRVGFTLPPCVAAGAVRSYRTFSPLPPPLVAAKAVSSLWH